MLFKLPIDIQDYILEYIDYKNLIKIYFKENIASLIDISFKKIDNGCEMCYIKYFQKYKNKHCHFHKYNLYNSLNNSKYFSLYNLPNSEIYNISLGKLFIALNDINQFTKIINNINKYEMHKLHKINNEIKMNIFKIN